MLRSWCINKQLRKEQEQEVNTKNCESKEQAKKMLDKLKPSSNCHILDIV